MHGHDHERQADIAHRHRRQQPLRHARDPAHPAEEHRRRQQHQDDARPFRVHRVGVAQHSGDGVGLYCVERDPEGEDQQHRERHAPEARTQAALDVERRPAAKGSVRHRHLEDLRQRRLDEGGGHAKQRHAPHPEDRARPAEGHRDRHPGDVSGANPRGKSNAEGLERRDAALRPLARRQHQPPEQTEAPDLHQSGHDTEVQACTHEHIDQQMTPEEGTQPIQGRRNRVHGLDRGLRTSAPVQPAGMRSMTDRSPKPKRLGRGGLKAGSGRIAAGQPLADNPSLVRDRRADSA